MIEAIKVETMSNQCDGANHKFSILKPETINLADLLFRKVNNTEIRWMKPHRDSLEDRKNLGELRILCWLFSQVNGSSKFIISMVQNQTVRSSKFDDHPPFSLAGLYPICSNLELPSYSLTSTDIQMERERLSRVSAELFGLFASQTLKINLPFRETR